MSQPLWVRPISDNDVPSLRHLLRAKAFDLTDTWLHAPNGPWRIYTPLAYAIKSERWDAALVILEFLETTHLDQPVVQYQDDDTLCAAAWAMRCDCPVDVLVALLGDGTDRKQNVWNREPLSNLEWASRDPDALARWKAAIELRTMNQRKERCLLAVVAFLGLRRQRRAACLQSNGKDTIRLIAGMVYSSKGDPRWDPPRGGPTSNSGTTTIKTITFN
jgi:hypothetical protein